MAYFGQARLFWLSTTAEGRDYYAIKRVTSFSSLSFDELYKSTSKPTLMSDSTRSTLDQ